MRIEAKIIKFCDYIDEGYVPEARGQGLRHSGEGRNP